MAAQTIKYILRDNYSTIHVPAMSNEIFQCCMVTDYCFIKKNGLFFAINHRELLSAMSYYYNFNI